MNESKEEGDAIDKPVSKWSQHVNETSNAMDTEVGVFKLKDHKKIAQSLWHSAAVSKRKKARTTLQSAMSMLNFYINRAGKNLPDEQKEILNHAKEELRVINRQLNVNGDKEQVKMKKEKKPLKIN